MREWLEPMGLRGAMKVSNVPLYQELVRRIGLLRGPLAISAVEQTRFLSDLAHQKLPFPRSAQQQVVEITRVDSGPGWSLHAKTGWQNTPGADDAPKRQQLGRASPNAMKSPS